MATNATILIPDISGFTEFMSNTELTHGSQAIGVLLDVIIKAVGDEFEISEIEGDAVLMFKRGAPPSKKEMVDICLKIFRAFHYQKKWMKQHNICLCGTCRAIENLTLKFVAHHGPVGEMKIGRFVTLSGPDVIVAHRLLKNSVPSNEYLLLTEKLSANFPDSEDSFEMSWANLSDEFGAIGKIDYQFAQLDIEREKTPDPPFPDNSYDPNDTPFYKLSIDADFRDVYMIIINIPGRAQWDSDLQLVEQDMPAVFIGSMHHCTFKNYKADISPLKMSMTEDEIIYAESCLINDLNISLVHEYVLNKESENRCTLSSRIINTGSALIPGEVYSELINQMKTSVVKLKEQAEGMEKSFF